MVRVLKALAGVAVVAVGGLWLLAANEKWPIPTRECGDEVVGIGPAIYHTHRQDWEREGWYLSDLRGPQGEYEVRRRSCPD